MALELKTLELGSKNCVSFFLVQTLFQHLLFYRQAYKYSGYQVMRLATELVPAVSAIITPRLFSPFWVVIFYFTMIVFGLAQQMALFHTVSSGLIAIKSDYFLQFESSLIFISCLLGLIFCFPLATEV